MVVYLGARFQLVRMSRIMHVDRDMGTESNTARDMIMGSRTIKKKRRKKGNGGHFQMI